MMPSEKSALRLKLLQVYLRFRMRACFHSVRLVVAGGEESLQSPLVLFGNHHSWWDGLIEVKMFQRLGWEFFVMMEEKHLRQFPFFRRTGAFGVDVATAGGRQAGLLHAVRLLRESTGVERALLIFPEGELHPAEEGIGELSRGLEGLARLVPSTQFRPLGKVILQYRHPKPEVLLRVGEPVGRDEWSTEGFSRALRRCWEEARQCVHEAGLPGERWLLPPARHRGQAPAGRPDYR